MIWFQKMCSCIIKKMMIFLDFKLLYCFTCVLIIETMFKNFNLVIETGKKNIEVPIHLSKMTDQKTSLKTGYKTESGIRPIKHVSVVTREDTELLRSVDDIEYVVDRSKVTSVLSIESEEGSKLIEIDKDILKRAIVNSRDIRVIFSTDMNNIKPYMYDGSHYNLELHGIIKKKVKCVELSDKRMHNILYHGMLSSGICMIGKYVCFNREKFCVIYSDSDRGMMLSNLIHSNYLRELKVSNIYDVMELDAILSGGISKSKKLSVDSDKSLYLHIFEKINENLYSKRVEMDKLRDKHEEILCDIIVKSREGFLLDKKVEVELDDFIVDDSLDAFL